jgi:hypothetical protein
MKHLGDRGPLGLGGAGASQSVEAASERDVDHWTLSPLSFGLVLEVRTSRAELRDEGETCISPTEQDRLPDTVGIDRDNEMADWVTWLPSEKGAFLVCSAEVGSSIRMAMPDDGDRVGRAEALVKEYRVLK